MFCSACGASNVDGAAFCNKCGAALGQAPAAVPIPSPQVVPDASGLPPGGRNPWVALILNLFFGVGYLYLGYKKVLGLRTILFVVVMLVAEILLGIFTFGILSFVAAVILAYDGYVKAKGGRGYLSTEPGIGYRP
jgi:hypothetical protein